MFAGGSLVGDLAGQTVGNVGSLEISQQEFASVFRNLEEEYRRQYNLTELPPELIRTITQESQTQLASEYLMRASVEEKQIHVPNSAIINEIRSIPDFQDENGEFSISLFNDYVTDDRQLETQIRQTLQRRPMLAVLDPYEISEVETKLAAYRRQQRIVEESVITVTAIFNISEDDISNYYSQNQRSYAIYEEADWEYIIIALSTYVAANPQTDITVSADDITLAYEEFIEEQTEQEQREASHILIEGDSEGARQRAEELAEQARQSPDLFAELAEANSADAGSADNGGSLGIIVRGDLPATMDDALFALQNPGDISAPVVIDGGFSILKLDSSSAPPLPLLEDIRDEVEERAKLSIVRDGFFDSLNTLQELAHINIGSLAQVALTAGISVQTATNIRPDPTENDSPIFSNEEILSLLFIEEILVEGETGEAIAIDDDHYMLARTTRYQEPSVRPLNEVSNEIAGLLNASEQINLIQDNNEAAEIASTLSWKGPYTLSLSDEAAEEDALVSGIALNEIFLTDLSAGLPAFSLVPASGMVRIFRIRDVVNGEPEESDIDIISEFLTGRYSAASGSAYLDSLAARHDINFNIPTQ